ncbi:hypothetical protein quinque_005918 [Culex quinquefasciatus]
MSRVKVLYDFQGEPNSAELTITVDDVLTVTNTEVGEGWWEGTNARGQRGLFPAAYVEVMPMAPPPAAGPPKMPPPPLKASVPVVQQQQPAQAPRYDQTADDWGEQQDGEWDDDWDDDQDTYSEIGPASGGGHQGQASNNQNGNFQSSNYYANANLPAVPVPNDGDGISLASTAVGGTRRATSSSKIFSSKAADAYLMGLSVPAVSESDRVQILQTDAGIVWKPMRDGYTVTVDSPKKEKKFNGLKSFIAYQLTPSFNGIAVSRRYKHFDWLHEQLVKKFCLIPVPPLPDKQISGRYDEEFVEHRRVQLQEFVDWMCRHPVLSTYYQRIGEGFSELARALEIDERRQTTQLSLSNSVGHAAGIFIAIGQLFADQPKHDFIPLGDRLHIYRGLLGGYPDALAEYRNGVQKRKDCEKLTAEQKMENSQLAEVNRRVDVMSYAMLAEMAHFRAERDTHLKDTMRNFIGAQIEFYKNIVRRLEQAQGHF